MGSGLQRVGFVGFGAMPSRMAARLRDASYSVVGYDPVQQEGEHEGIRMVGSAAAVAGEVDAILVAVPNDAALDQSMRGEGGALDGARPDQLIVNFSTVSPGASRSLGKVCSERQIAFVEAPMSGSTPEAESGRLVFLAGGTDADIAAAAPILGVLGRRTVHAGAVGEGLVTKLIINGVMALGTAALAEGLAYGMRAGVDRDMLIDTLSDLILVSEHHKRKLAMAKDHDYPTQFSTRLMSKDMGLLLADASLCGAPIPSMAAASQLYVFASQAYPDDDYASAIAALEDVIQEMPSPSAQH